MTVNTLCPTCGQSADLAQHKQKVPLVMQEGVANQTTTLVECKPPAFIVDVFRQELSRYPQDLQMVMNKALASNYMVSSKFDEECYRDLKQLVTDNRIVGGVRAAAEWLLLKMIVTSTEACIQAERRCNPQQGNMLIAQNADVKLAANVATLQAFALIPQVEVAWDRDQNVLDREVPAATEAFFEIANRRVSNEDMDKLFWFSQDPWQDSGFKSTFEQARQRIMLMNPQQKAKFLFESIKPLSQRPSIRDLAVTLDTPKEVMNFSATAVFRLGF